MKIIFKKKPEDKPLLVCHWYLAEKKSTGNKYLILVNFPVDDKNYILMQIGSDDITTYTDKNFLDRFNIIEDVTHKVIIGIES